MENSVESKRIIAGITAILIGTFGVHKFILGYNKEGIYYLVINLVILPTIGFITCGAGLGLYSITYLIPIIEGIIYLTKSDEEFVNTYQVNKKAWF
ncbi:MAG: TM2 domain-containing protein [Flavobacteriales bacterium]